MVVLEILALNQQHQASLERTLLIWGSKKTKEGLGRLMAHDKAFALFAQGSQASRSIQESLISLFQQLLQIPEAKTLLENFLQSDGGVVPQ